MAINALTISGPIAGDTPITVQDYGNGIVACYQGDAHLNLPKEVVGAYASDVAGLVAFLKDILHGETPAGETDKARADRLEAVLQRIANESREHFATSLAMEALQGWDPRKPE